jgi:4-hydroxyphenylpyruvate dioxygenase-like putative hemolysin
MKEKFAKELGFTDYSDLCENSVVIFEEGDVTWYVTELPNGRWAAWDDAEISLRRVAYFATRDEAVAYQKAGMEIAEE